MKKIVLLILLKFLLINSVSAQADIPVIGPLLNYFTGIEDSVGFIEFNFSGNPALSDIVNGFRFSAYTATEQTTEDVLNEITEVPVWKNGPEISKLGGSFSMIFNPVLVSVGADQTKFNLNEVETFIALPPVNPEADNYFKHNLTINTLFLEADYIPLSMFWGYFYPTAGLCGYSKIYQYESQTEFYITGGLKAGGIIKYRNIFLSMSYRKFLLNSDYFFDSDIYKIEFGTWFNIY